MDKYDSTDFWYTFLNSLYNFGFAAGRGKLEMDEEMQDKLLTYFKEKIEVGVVDGVTALPPGLHDYFWRFPEVMLPKLRTLAEGFLETDPENAAATLILTIVAGEERDPEYQTHLETLMRLIPKDPGTNLIIINEFHRNQGSLSGEFDGEETFLTVLENLYEWAKQEGATDRYQDVKSAYYDIGRSPGTPYGRAKKKLKKLKEEPENPALQKVRRDHFEKCKTQIKRCINLFYEEHAAFQKESLQNSDDKQDFGDPTSEKIDFWETYLNSLDDRELSSSNWKLTPTIQVQLLRYFKTRIEVGVVEGKTALPAELQKYVSRFPKVMRIELREFAEDVLEKQPNNGAAAKILAIIVEDKEFPYLEQAIELLPNDAEMCFFAIKRYSEPFSDCSDSLLEQVLSTLEKLFASAQQQDGSELYHWLTKLYKEIGITPCYIYRKLMKCVEGNTKLIERCKLLINQAERAFQQRIEEEPDDWYALRGLGDIYQTLGKTELAQEYPWEPHPEFRWAQTAWVGRQLPNFSATTLDGEPFSFSDYHGKLVLLNFCAWWCGPCKGEIPYIKQVYEEHHKNGFEAIRISIDENEEDLRKYIEEHDIPGIQLFDEKGIKGELPTYFGVNRLPSQWLIDRDRIIISVETRQDRLVNFVKWSEISRVGNVIPDFSAEDIKGNLISSSSYKGKVVLLFFNNNEQVLTQVDTIYRKYHTKGFEVFGFRPYDTLANQFGIDPWRPLPAIVLIDKGSKVITSRYGQVHSPETWWARLEELVAAHLEGKL